jgi:hypothetical protein
MISKHHIFISLGLLAMASQPVLAVADTPTPGDIPDNQAFVRITGPGYSLSTPEGWARVTHGKVVTLSDKYNAISIRVGSAAKAPTVASVTAQDLPRLRSATPGFRAPKVTTVTRPAGRAVLLRYEARSPRDAVTGRTVANDVERYEFWKAGRLAVVTLQAPHGSDNVDPWRTVTTSFRWR